MLIESKCTNQTAQSISRFHSKWTRKSTISWVNIFHLCVSKSLRSERLNYALPIASPHFHKPVFPSTTYFIFSPLRVSRVGIKIQEHEILHGDKSPLFRLLIWVQNMCKSPRPLLDSAYLKRYHFPSQAAEPRLKILYADKRR